MIPPAKATPFEPRILARFDRFVARCGASDDEFALVLLIGAFVFLCLVLVPYVYAWQWWHGWRSCE